MNPLHDRHGKLLYLYDPETNESMFCNSSNLESSEIDLVSDPSSPNNELTTSLNTESKPQSEWVIWKKNNMKDRGFLTALYMAEKLANVRNHKLSESDKEEMILYLRSLGNVFEDFSSIMKKHKAMRSKHKDYMELLNNFRSDD